MLPLFFIIHIFVGSTLAGSAVIAALSLGYTSGRAVVVAALIGFVLSIPASWIVAKKLFSSQS